MKTPKTTLHCVISRTAALLISSSALALAVPAGSAAPATDSPTLHSLADKAPKLPLDSSFKKESSGENKGLYTLTLKNVSQHSVNVSASVELSVVVHNRDKTRAVPSQAVEPGKTIQIEALAAHDKVTITADGFEPLQLTVP